MGWMGPVVGDQAHEGWAVPLFADGAQGAGTTSARGVLVARRPDDGLRDGDRVRLTYRGGCTVEGIWQDGAVIGVDGIVHHTGGQVRREVIEEAEEWRPDAAVVGWVAGCTCGWRGSPWTRVPVPQLAEPAARRLAVTGPWADLEAADENRVMQEWRRHIELWRTLEDVEQAAARQAAAARALDEAVYAARAAGASWTAIGGATSLTGRSAIERWSAGG